MSGKFDVSDLNLPLRKLIQQREETEAEVESLCNMMYLMNKARLKYESSVEYMNNSTYSLEGLRSPYYLPDSIYAQGDTCDFNMGANFGAEFRTRTEKENAINHFFAKIEKINLKLSVAQRLLAAKILEREKLKKAATERLLAEKRAELEAGFYST